MGSGMGECSQGVSWGGGEFGGISAVEVVRRWGFEIGENNGEEGGGWQGEGVLREYCGWVGRRG